MEVKLLKENEDGSADYSFDLSAEEQDDLIREKFNLGLKTKSGRGKYETNIIQAEQLIDLF